MYETERGNQDNMLKAVIMAGGEGSRLRPLTCNLPKPMTRLCGRPVLEYILDLLSTHGVKEAALTLGYLPNEITGYFPNGQYENIKLGYASEETPLGTAGGVKNAVKQAGITFNNDFVVISGDALCDIDLSAAVAHHKRMQADATIIVTRVADPREYGLVTFEQDTVVTGFVEKPGWNQAVTNAANTGIYILRPGLMNMIPDDKSYDFAKDLFSQMLLRGMKICVFETSDYWCDIGDLATYRNCQSDILSGKLKTGHAGNEFNTSEFIKLADVQAGDLMVEPEMTAQVKTNNGAYQIIEPVYIGDSVRIGNGAVIGPDTVLDDGVTVAAMAKVRHSVLLPHSHVGDRARLTGAILCTGASVKSGAAVFEGAVIGSGAVVGAGAEIKPDVLIWPGKQVEAGTKVAEHMRHGSPRPEFFDDDGISGEAGIDLTPEFCARVGAAAGSLKCADRVGIASVGGRAAKALKSAFIAGVLSTGSPVWDFGEIMESQISFAASFCGLHVSAYFTDGPVCSIKLLGDGGLPVSRPIEREFESHLSRGEFSRCTWNDYQDVADMDGILLLYQQELYRAAPGGLSGMKAQVHSANSEGERLFTDILVKLGCEVLSGLSNGASNNVIMTLSRTGTRLSMSDGGGCHLSPEQVLSLCCLIDFEQGRDVALPYDAPQVIDGMAARYGCRVHRYYSCPADSSDLEAREYSRNQLWLRDGMMAGLKILNHLKQKGLSLPELAAALPKFATVVRSFNITETVASAIHHLPEDRKTAGEGVKISRERGNLLITPGKQGRTLKVMAEAVDSETAEELYAEIADVFK